MVQISEVPQNQLKIPGWPIFDQLCLDQHKYDMDRKSKAYQRKSGQREEKTKQNTAYETRRMLHQAMSGTDVTALGLHVCFSYKMLLLCSAGI